MNFLLLPTLRLHNPLLISQRLFPFYFTEPILRRDPIISVEHVLNFVIGVSWIYLSIFTSSENEDFQNQIFEKPRKETKSRPIRIAGLALLQSLVSGPPWTHDSSSPSFWIVSVNNTESDEWKWFPHVRLPPRADNICGNHKSSQFPDTNFLKTCLPSHSTYYSPLSSPDPLNLSILLNLSNERNEQSGKKLEKMRMENENGSPGERPCLRLAAPLCSLIAPRSQAASPAPSSRDPLLSLSGSSNLSLTPSFYSHIFHQFSPCGDREEPRERERKKKNLSSSLPFIFHPFLLA